MAQAQPPIELRNQPDRLLPRGYAWYAAWIAEDKDNEADVYRSFRRLSARTLLYRQSELIELESQLADIDHGDAQKQKIVRPGDMEAIDNITTRWPLPNSAEEHDRVKLIEKIDLKLKEYHELLVLQNKVFALEEPEDRVVRALKYQNTLRDPRYIQGRGATYLNDYRDLVALRKPPEKDPLTKLFRTYLGNNRLFRKRYVVHEDLRSGHSIDLSATFRYSEGRINTVTAAISTALAAILLFGSILSLHFIKSEVARLVVVPVLTAVFAILVKLTTTASRSEVFGGAAAYAAVLVVYVGGALNTGGSS